MKKELIIYIGLTVIILALFSFELVLKKQSNSLDISSLSTDKIHSISIDMPANIYFTAGDENKVLLEGQSELLDLVELNENNGHIVLQLGTENNFL